MVRVVLKKNLKSQFCTWGLGFRVYIKTVYARRGGGISWYLERGVGLHLVLDVQELGLLELNLGFEGAHDFLDLFRF